MEIAETASRLALQSMKLGRYGLGGGLRGADPSVERGKLLLPLSHCLDDSVYFARSGSDGRNEVVDLGPQLLRFRLHGAHLLASALHAINESTTADLERVGDHVFGEHVPGQVVHDGPVDILDGATKARRAHLIAARPVILAEVDLDGRVRALAVLHGDGAPAFDASSEARQEVLRGSSGRSVAPMHVRPYARLDGEPQLLVNDLHKRDADGEPLAFGPNRADLGASLVPFTELSPRDVATTLFPPSPPVA